jgi:DNA polymerase-3 subunit beta
MRKGGFSMKVKVTNLKDFRNALSFATLSSEASKALEVAGCVLLEAKEDKLTMTFTDLSMRVKAEIPAEIVEEGTIAVNAKNLASFVKNTEGWVVIEACEDKVKLYSEKAEIVLKAFNAEDFPLGIEVEADIVYAITIQANILKQALEKLLFIPLPNDCKPVESSIYMHISNGELRFCATDKFRLGIVSLTKQCNIENVSTLLPERAARALYRIVNIVPANDVTILLYARKIATRTVTVSKISAVSFFAGSFVLLSPSLDYEYPEYQRILAGRIVGTVRVNRKQLVDALRPLAKTKEIIRLSYDQNHLVVIYEENGTKAISRIHCRANGSVPQFAVNTRFLLEPLKVIKDEEITMKFSGPLMPVIVESKDYTYVVAPFRLP